MEKVIFFLLFFLPVCTFAQETEKVKQLNLQLEVGGNALGYSVGIEFFTPKKKRSTGDRIGISYLPSGSSSKYLTAFYEKNLILGHKKIKYELGGGITFGYNFEEYYYSPYYGFSNEVYYFKYYFYLSTRFGIRYDVNDKTHIRLGALMFVDMIEIDNKKWGNLIAWGGLSVGFKLK